MNTKARITQLPQFTDPRGTLIVGDGGSGAIPFDPVRFFVIRDVPPGAVRGSHAHKHCHQLMIAVQGSCRVTLIDHDGRDDLLLDSPSMGVHVPPKVWAEQSDFAPNTIVLVLASDHYDANDYIRSIAELEATAHR